MYVIMPALCVYPSGLRIILVGMSSWWALAGMSEAEALFVFFQKILQFKLHCWDFVSVDNIVNRLLLFSLEFLPVK